MDGLQSTYHWLDKRVAKCTLSDMAKAIRQDGAELAELSPLLTSSVTPITVGCMVLSYDPSDDVDGILGCQLQVCFFPPCTL